MNTRGMIKIPKILRDKFKFKQGSKFCIMELDGVLSLIPILSEEELQHDLIPDKNLLESMEEDHKQQIEMEK